MTPEDLSTLFSRDLEALKNDILAYEDESKLWVLDGQISNTAGNLCLHLIGNLNHFIGAQLGDTGYVRDRPNEFNAKNVPREEMIADLDRAIQMIQSVLGGMEATDVAKTYPLQVLGRDFTTGQFLLHLYGHLSYHKGQVNYHRRLLG